MNNRCFSSRKNRLRNLNMSGFVWDHGMIWISEYMIWCMAYDILYLNCVLKEVVIDDTTTIWRCSKDGMKRKMFWSCCKGVIRRPKFTSMLFLEKASIPWWRRRKHVFFYKKLRWKEWRKTCRRCNDNDIICMYSYIHISIYSYIDVFIYSCIYIYVKFIYSYIHTFM